PCGVEAPSGITNGRRPLARSSEAAASIAGARSAREATYRTSAPSSRSRSALAVGRSGCVPFATRTQSRPSLAATAAVALAWFDPCHAVRGLTRAGTFVFLTDSAVGTKEEDNLRHLIINLGSDVPRSRVVPFLTCKHTAEYCFAYADRARHNGFESLVILGGDKHVGPPRCVEHAWQLREMIRAREADLALGGWANPHADAATQVRHLLADRVTAEFYLTQIVSHHSRPAVERFL